MSLYSVITDASMKKHSVEVSRVVRTKGYFYSLYQDVRNRLYDAGYISEPNVRDDSELIASAYDLGVVPVEMSGAFSTDPRFLKLYLKTKKGTLPEDTYNFLELFVLDTYYKKMVEDLDGLYSKHKMAGRRKLQVPAKYNYRSCRVTARSGFTASEATLMALSAEGHVAEERTMGKGLLQVVLDELGIREEYESSNAPAFVEGLTKEEEVGYLDIILAGRVRLNGRLSNRVKDWVSEQSGEGVRAGREDFLTILTRKKYSDIENAFARVVEADLAEGEVLLGFNNMSYYIQKKVTDETYSYPLGLYAFGYVGSGSEVEVEDLGFNAALRGYSGEFQLESSLQGTTEAENVMDVCPVPFEGNKGKVEYRYPIEQVYSKPDTIWNSLGARLNFGGGETPDSPFIMDSLEDRLFKGYYGTQESGPVSLTLTYKEYETGLTEAIPAVVKVLEGEG